MTSAPPTPSTGRELAEPGDTGIDAIPGQRGAVSTTTDASGLRHIRLHRWSGAAALKSGLFASTRAAGASVVLADPATPVDDLDACRDGEPSGFQGRSRTSPAVESDLPVTDLGSDRDGEPSAYEGGSWAAPVVETDFPVVDLVSSWNADTPPGTWVIVEVRVVGDGDHDWSPWFTLARWCSHEDGPVATSVTGQRGRVASVDVDRLRAADGRHFERWQLRIQLLRRRGVALTPVLHALSAVTTQWPSAESAVVAAVPGPAVERDLDVPAYAQRLHAGHSPHWGGGGASWCSPTSVSMLLAFWDRLPDPSEYAWVSADDPAPWVDHAAKGTYDAAYRGCGNWSFNAAYAARLGLDAFVTRLRSLEEAAAFIAAGIPLVAAISFPDGELTGAGYTTNGHLLVIRGFTAVGDVITNDPAAHGQADDAQVRTVYDRREFGSRWLDHAGGLVYVIRPHDVPLPAAYTAEPNW